MELTEDDVLTVIAALRHCELAEARGIADGLWELLLAAGPETAVYFEVR